MYPQPLIGRERERERRACSRLSRARAYLHAGAWFCLAHKKQTYWFYGSLIYETINLPPLLRPRTAKCNNARRRCDSRVERRYQAGRTDLTKGKRTKRNAAYDRAGINKFRSKLRSRDQVGRCTRLMGFCGGDKSARTYISALADKREKPAEREIVSVFIVFRVSRRQILDNIP